MLNSFQYLIPFLGLSIIQQFEESKIQSKIVNPQS